MGELRITDLVDAEQIKLLNDLNQAVQRVKTTYAGIGKELVMGLKIDVETKGDLDKLNTIVASSAKKATESSKLLNEALQKQHELSEKVAQSLDRMAKSGQLSAKDAKTLADASKKNAEALEKEAKAEAALEKARNAGNKSRKALSLTEEERKKKIQEALVLADKEVHSIAEANEANKQLRKAVKLVKDTDEDYIKTIGKLNSTIGVNTDYIDRNSDRYTQQKMAIGRYKEEIKQAYYELTRGNGAMKNFGIIAGNTSKILNKNLSIGVSKVGIGIGTMIKGFVGAQAVLTGIQSLVGLVKGGVRTAIDFQSANSKLAAVLGTTADKTKDLQMQARELGASTKYTAAEATNLQIELSKLGFTVEEIKNATPHVLKFAQATGAELSEGAALSGAALRMFGANSEETERYVSAMAVATARSALSFEYLATAMPIVGPVAKSFNFTIEDTLALIGKLSDSGFDASMAATATRNILLNLADSSGKLAKALGKPVTNLPELVDGLKKLKEQGVDLNTTLELTDKRSVAAFNAFLTAADQILPLREQITGVNEELSKMAKTMSNNTEGALKSLSSAWDELMISIMGNTGLIRTTIDYVTKLVRGMAELLQSIEDFQTKQTNIETGAGEKRAVEKLKNINEDILNIKRYYVKQGLKEDEALEKARKNYLYSFEMQLKNEELAISTHSENIKKYDGEKTWYNRALLHEVEENGKKIYLTYDGLIKRESELKAKAEGRAAEFKRIIEGINSIGVTDTVTTNNKKELTDEEKNALEKAAKERQKIEQQLQDANIAIMEDGLEKEIATISTNYNRKIAAIKGNSEQEKELRKTLGVLMQKEIADAKRKHQEKLDEEQAKRDEQAMQEKADRLLEQSEIEATNISTSQILANTELEDAYKQGLIDREEYEKEKFELQKHYNEMALRNTIETAKAMIALMPDGADKDKAIAKLREQMAKLKEVMSSEFGGGDDDKEWGAKTWKEKWSEAIDFVSESFNGVVDLIGGMTDRRIQELEREIEANEKAGDKELERIQHLADTGVFTTEEAEARKRAAEERTAAKTEELERKKAALQTRQAKLEKAANIASVIMNTATAIMKAWGQAGIFGAPMAALIGAMGAIQLATVIAQPIPKYAKGTDDHPGGFAIVGDGGRSEAVMTKDGVWFTPSVPTLVNLPEHAIVYPDAKDLPNDDFPEFSAPFVMRGSGDSSATTIINDYSKLEKKVDATNALLAQGFRNINRDSSYRNLQMYMMSRL